MKSVKLWKSSTNRYKKPSWMADSKNLSSIKTDIKFQSLQKETQIFLPLLNRTRILEYNFTSVLVRSSGIKFKLLSSSYR
jgi:hypothetical protein